MESGHGIITDELSPGGASSESFLRRRRSKISQGEAAAEATERSWPWHWLWIWGRRLVQKLFGETPRAWRSFQQQRLRKSVESEQQTVPALSCIVLFGSTLRIIWSPDDYVFVLTNTAIFAMGSFALVLLAVRLKASATHSVNEWYLCIAHQSLFILSFYLFTSNAVLSVDGLVSHRSFLMRFFLALASMVHTVYLPQPWHTAFVFLPGLFTWVFFHCSVGFTKPGASLWGIVVPALEMLAFELAELREWHLFRAMEDERHARQAGENAKEAMRGMLNVVFDASCECDLAGRLLSVSDHLTSLLGARPDALLNVDLPSLAASPEESKRIIDFLVHCAPTDAGLAVRPPSLVETSLRRQGETSEDSRSVLRVKLCCVALPFQSACDDELDNCKQVQRVFVGLQAVEAPLLPCDLREESSEQDIFPPCRAQAPKPIHARAKPWKKLNLLRERSSIGAGPQQNSSDEERDADVRSLSSLAISLTGTHVTSVLPVARVSVGTQTLPTNPNSFTSSSSKACQTSGASRCPPIPGTFSIGRNDRSHLHQKRSKRKTLLSQTAFLARWKGTPSVTIEFIVMEQVLAKTNPLAQGCCFWHASLQFLASVIQDMLTRKCNRKFGPHVGWQCQICKGLNERVDTDSEKEENEAVVCGVCDSERASLSGNDDAQSERGGNDVDSDLPTESIS